MEESGCCKNIRLDVGKDVRLLTERKTLRNINVATKDGKVLTGKGDL